MRSVRQQLLFRCLVFTYDCTENQQTCVDGIWDEAVCPPPEAELCAGNAGKQEPIPPACTSYTLCTSVDTTAFPPEECPDWK